MAWNRSDPNSKPVVAKKPSAWRGVVALIAVAVIGGLVVWLMMGDDAAKEDVRKDRGLIKEVKPAIPPRTNEVAKVEPKKVDPNARPTKVGEIVNGYIKLPSGRIHKRVGVITNSPAHRVKGDYEIFKRHCDNEIAAFLWMKPGHGIVAMPPYNGRFVKDFLESLKEPIIPTKDDTPEQAELKRAVNEAKIELKAAYDRGEDIEQIMMDTRKEMMQLANYRREIEQQLYEFRKKEGVTPEDIDDFVTACNQLLDKKGIAPMKLGPIARRKLTMKHEGDK